MEQVHCRDCKFEPKNQGKPAWLLCLHPEALRDETNKNPCKYFAPEDIPRTPLIDAKHRGTILRLAQKGEK